jgi:MFS family permease
MYQVQDSTALVKGHRALLKRGRARVRVSRTVLFLGGTSLFTDISSEMVATILPLYLVYTQGLSPVQYGVVDGLYQGASALVRIASGFLADRFRRYKEIAAAGYGLSAVCKLGLLAVGSTWTAISGVVLLDRTGKGIRTAPRDALISLSSPRDGLGTAFGVHRALDTTGAMLGPLVAFGLLALAPLGFDAIFIVSFCFALIGWAILMFFVQNRPARQRASTGPTPSLRAATRLLTQRRFRTLVVVAAGLGLATASDGFLYLALQREVDMDPSLFPLLFVGTALIYMLLAAPLGRLADLVGRARVFIAGYALLLSVYMVLLMPGLGLALLIALPLLGVYYAATDGVLMALAGGIVPAELQGSGMAVVGTATGIARLLASVLFGAIWTASSLETALVVFAGALGVVLVLAAVALARTTEPRHA